MRFSLLSATLLFLSSSHIVAHPQPATEQLAQRDALAVLDAPVSEAHEHWKRKGGGGGGGKGGGGGGGGSSGGGSSGGGSSGGKGGSSSSSSSSSSSGSSSSGRTGSSSNTGGATSRGSGATRNYGGGRYYGGGATTPYAAGGRSPAGLLAFPLLGVALLAYPGAWLYGAYGYNYYHPYSFYNRTARRNRTATSTTTSATATPTANGRRGIVAEMMELVARQDSDLGVNETKQVTCLCAMYAVCGCDDNGDVSFLNSIIGDGDYSKLNKSLVQVADINGTSHIIINGTLPNGTTAPGGVDDSAATNIRAGNLSGYLVMVAVVGFTCFMI